MTAAPALPTLDEESIPVLTQIGRRARALRPALATGALIALTAIAYACQSSLPAPERELLVLRWATIPLELTEQDLPPVVPFPLPTAVTLLTALLLHGGWLHLGGNLLVLGVFGGPVESRVGPWRFLGLYLLGGAAGGLAHVAAHPLSLVPLVGGSGGVAALMGAYLALNPRLSPRSLALAIWLTPQLADGLREPTFEAAWVGGMATWAHLGGLLAGGLLTLGWQLWVTNRMSRIDRKV